MRALRGAAGLLLAALLAPAGAAAAPVSVSAGGGSTLRIETAPFRVAVVDARGQETLATVPARPGPPVRVPGIDGPQPAEPLGPLGGFPAVGWVVGTKAETTIPFGLFAGNRLFGAEAGALVSATGVRRATTTAEGVDVELDTDAPAVGPARLSATRLPGGGVRLRVRPPDGLPVVASTFTLASPRDEGLYGLGARKDAFDQRGRLRNVWVEQQNAGDERTETVTGADPTGTTGDTYSFPNGPQAAYYVQAALFGSRGWGAWVGETELSRVDLAVSRADAVRWGVASPTLTLTLAGGGLERAARSFSAVNGRAPAPPRYVYEPWIDIINEGEGEAAPNGSGFAGGARVKADLEEVVRMSRRLGIPIGVLGMEGWHQIPDGPAFFARLRRQGFRLSGYWNPFTAPSSPAHAEALAKGYFIKDATGRPFPVVTSRNTVANVIDFTNPEAARWWKTQLDRSNRLGFEAFMHDFGEFVTEGMRFHNGMPPERAHNAYPVFFHRAARAAVDAYARENPGFEPWFYVRAGYSGIGAEPGVAASSSGVFPGDETTDWAKGSGIPSVVPAMLNLALGGSYTFTTDVGGYFDFVAPRTSAELLIRWSQLAAFTPVSRIHNSTAKRSVMPWDFGEVTEDAYRRYAHAKMRLIPLVDRLSKRAARDGSVGPVRPLVLEDPSPAARRIGDQWLLGRDILVAPVLRPGARSRRVYLPAGSSWERVVVSGRGRLQPTGDVQPGGRSVTAPAPLADIPIYKRVVRRCLAPRVPVGPRSVGRVRLRRTAGQILRRTRLTPVRRSRRSMRLCVRGGGRVDVAFRRRRAELVLSTAPRHGNRRVRRGSSTRRVRRAFPRARRVSWGVVRLGPRSRRIVVVSRGRVRSLGVADRRLLSKRSRLRRQVRLLRRR
jgi:sulfoquinovosidase